METLKENYTIVLVPHSIQQAARTADFAAFFLQGKLVEHLPGRSDVHQSEEGRNNRLYSGAVWLVDKSV